MFRLSVLLLAMMPSFSLPSFPAIANPLPMCQIPGSGSEPCVLVYLVADVHTFFRNFPIQV